MSSLGFPTKIQWFLYTWKGFKIWPQSSLC